jgi:hypothetical protein
LPHQAKDFERATCDTNKIEPNLVNLNWAIRVLHKLNIKGKIQATHGNLMNLLDLAKSNRADN